MLNESPAQKALMTVGTPIFNLVTKDPESGAQTSLTACLAPFKELQSGKYYADCKVEPEKISPEWPTEAKRLWVKSEKAV